MNIKEYKELTEPLEFHQCVNFVAYLEDEKQKGNVLKFTHIPNETYTPSWNQKRKNKALGVRPGFPDYFIITKKTPVAIEMKRTKGGKTSPEQTEWIELFNQFNIPASVCNGSDEAIAFMEGLL